MKKARFNLFITQFYGVFNDNLLKSLICFVAVYWLSPENRSMVIPCASALLVLPFILFSPLAGALAQRYPKQQILQLCKLAELPIMAIAITGFYFQSLAVVMFALLLMALQSAIYSPSKYGLIKEISQEEGLSETVGIMEMLSFAAVLLGTTLAGFIADAREIQTLLLATALAVPAIMGYVSSTRITRSEAANKKDTSISLNPYTFTKSAWKQAKSFKGVNSSLVGLGIFWLVASIVQMNLLVHCPERLGFTPTQTGFVTAALAIGIGLGCFAAGRVTKSRLEIGIVPFAGIGLSLATMALSFNLSPTFFIVVLIIAAFLGGLFKVPLDAWVQERSSKEKLGQILALSNMVVFIFFLLSAALFALAQPIIGSKGIFLLTGGIMSVTSLVCFIKLPAAVVRFILWTLAHTIYKLRISGMENISKTQGAILVCNHVSLLDSLLVVAAVPRNTRFVMHEKVYHNPWLHWFFKSVNMIPVGDNKSKEDLWNFTMKCKQELDNQHMVCLFTEGQISRNGHLLEFKKGIEYLIKASKAPVVLLHMGNVVGSPLSYQTGTCKTYGFNFRTLRRLVYLKISEAYHQPLTSFQIRQKMKELEVYNFKQLIKDHNYDTGMALEKAHQMVLLGKDKTGLLAKNGSDLENLVVSTPDCTIKDISGKQIQLNGSQPGSIGRPLPGVAVKVVDIDGNELPENQSGIICYLAAFWDDVHWKATELWGSIDREGFVRLG
ncbi:MFS transporter [Cytophagaceae bacterium ABcell3]|nr:MFS transporter [Cytophagaceae bacterium ABcell3]